MADLQKLSDQDLLTQTKTLAAREREILTDVLKHLREVRRRRLFSELKYRSMMDYAVRELGYTEDQAYHRLAAMELLELPEVEVKIASGALSLSNLSLASKVIRAESKAAGAPVAEARKEELLAAVEGKTKREAETAVQKITTAPPEMLRSEIIRRVDDRLEIRLSVPKSLEGKIQKIKDWLSHAHPDLTTAELFEKLCDAYIERREKNKTSIIPNSVPGREVRRAIPPRSLRKARAHISMKLRREAFAKSGGSCQNCGGTRFLELDHKIPLGKGGTNEAENLRVLCRSCNARAAVQSYGQIKMDVFLQRR